ncbi:DUF262 domain-containing protein [Ramlibacter sp.]|uniref:DUF262 domain-containing protein n=1 Tax=Ramlibacter sp. TaxID=1917967 RepID=UPI0017DDB9E3|nr:DUF262 domain-containing protein [Ramlibacter sp.]MBA2672544.1 DUF262 domain-containing protein [Ramlibacter sp.]
MKAEDTGFLTLVGSGQKQFIIPVFQRDYSWTEAQCAQLLSDIQRVAARPIGASHFLGSVVYVASSDQSAVLPQWLVIDGQQRLTTGTILLAVLRDRLRVRDEPLAITDSPDAVEEQFLINKFSPANLRSRLALRGEDNSALQALLAGEQLPDSPTSRVVANARYFQSALAEVDPVEVLNGLRRILVVSVALKPGQDNPQLIFESLNSTGLALTQADLVRNYVLMGHLEPRQTEWYERWWYPLEQAFGAHYRAAFDKFLRDFLTLELNPPRPLKLDAVYREFRHWYPAPGDPEQSQQNEQRLSRLLRFGRHYCTFMFNPQNAGDAKDGLRRLQQLVDVAAPAVMMLLERWRHDKALTEDEMVDATGVLESYVLRRSIAGAETRSAGQVFAALARRIAADRPVARLKAALARSGKGAEFPDDTAFFQALTTQDLYGRRNLKFLLERLTNAGKEKVITDNLTIEHVLPQKSVLAPEWQEALGPDWRTAQARCLHKLGNLTLTGFNSELEARPFAEKRAAAVWGYVNSQVWLSKSIAEQQTWGEKQIAERGEMLAKLALTVWQPLNADKAMIAKLELEEAIEHSADHKLENLKWTVDAAAWFDQVRAAIVACSGDVVELPRARSVVYRAPEWFVEIIPRSRGFTLRMAADASELVDLEPNVQDAATWAFVVNSTVEGGSLFVVSSQEQVSIAIALISRTYELMFD